MYKVFIVDDEPLVVRSLKASVNWNEYGFNIIGEAYNGIDAYELIQQYRPDIVFTDIRMPGLNGLELIKKIKEVSLTVKFIVVSAYAEFAYAQRAINYGALGFCLKPFDDVEIITMLNKAKETLDKSSEVLDNDFLTIIEENDFVHCEKLERIIHSFGLKVDQDSPIATVVSIGAGRLNFPNNIKYFCLKMGSHKYVYFINCSNQSDIIEQLNIKMLPDNIKGVGIGNILNPYEHIKENIENASINAYQYFITGVRGIYKATEYNPDQLKELMRRLEEVVGNKNIVLIHNMLDEFGDMFKKGIYNVKDAFILYNLLTSYLYRLNVEYDESYLYNIEQLLDLFDSAQNMIVYFKSIFEKYLNEGHQYTPGKVKNNMFKNILKYVNENFSKGISLQSISQKFTINPSYISQLFRKEVGITFTEYLTKLRISLASDLLKTTDLSVGEISEKVGYIDYFYFTRTFKKTIGKTPSQYRNLCSR